MPTAYLLLAALFFVSSVQEASSRKAIRKQYKGTNYLTIYVGRTDLVVPMAWKEVFFQYESIPSSGPFSAANVFKFARTYSMDTVEVLSEDVAFQFLDQEWATFLRDYNPISLERIFNSSPFDTIRIKKGKTIKVPDMSVHYRLYFQDTALTQPLEALKGIPSVRHASRPGLGGIEHADPTPNDSSLGNQWHLKTGETYGSEVQKVWALKNGKHGGHNWNNCER